MTIGPTHSIGEGKRLLGRWIWFEVAMSLLAVCLAGALVVLGQSEGGHCGSTPDCDHGQLLVGLPLELHGSRGRSGNTRCACVNAGAVRDGCP